MGAGSFTRSLFEKSGKFAVQVPFVSQAQLVAKMGTISMRADAGKLEGVEMFYEQGVPMVRGCAAWLVCKRIPEPHNEQSYDLFIGEVVAVYADERVFDGGHWLFEKIPDELKTLHYVAGGRYLSRRQSGRYQAHAHKRRVSASQNAGKFVNLRRAHA